MTAGTKQKIGRALSLLGLLIVPAAVIYGLNGGDIYNEILLFGMGTALWMMGRGLSAAPTES